MDCISDRPPSLFSAEDYEHVDFDLQRSTAEVRTRAQVALPDLSDLGTL